MSKKTRNITGLRFLFALAALGFATLTLNAVAFAQGAQGKGRARGRRGVGAVYVLTNARAANGVAIFSRDPDGFLNPRGTVATGGQGTGGLLDAQGSLILSEGHEWLFAVNALSNEISVFAVIEGGGLTLIDKVSSGGERPISLTASEDLLYVLNSGGSGNITAFAIGPDGRLTQLTGSSRPFSTAAFEPCPRPTDAGRTCNVAGPAQVQFSPGGDVLVVTERITSRILTYTISNDGRATQSSIFQGVTNSTPFGFDFAKRGRLIVSNAFLD
ncbi:MAG: beta-propeller fold lactonase family protein, partial [Acidobacteria bacterium]|nr:beta-propeller fold lactonase family protein [Acidobacteriota bacterium]